MKIKHLAVAAALLFLVALSVTIAINLWKSYQQKMVEEQWVAEAQEALVAYLRETGADIDAAPDEETKRLGLDRGELDRSAVLEKLGSLESITGSGYSHAVWNIQGYDYLIAHREGKFSNATVPLMIYVLQGSATAPGKSAIYVHPKIEFCNGAYYTFYVSHQRLHG
jgi:hypothetical protein